MFGNWMFRQPKNSLCVELADARNEEHDVIVNKVEYIMSDPTSGTIIFGEEPKPMATRLPIELPHGGKADRVLRRLKEGNRRFASGETLPACKRTPAVYRAMAENDNGPMAVVIGCADSRCPLETLFDANPGDLFVLRNAGNTCVHSEGGIIASVEYSVSHLDTNLIIVLGHTNCHAVSAACKAMQANSERESSLPCTTMIAQLMPMAEQAAEDLPPDASFDMLVKRAVEVNTLHTVSRLLEYSSIVRAAVGDGSLQVEGAIYDAGTSTVDFIGPSPHQAQILGSVPQLPMQREASSSLSSLSTNTASVGGID